MMAKGGFRAANGVFNEDAISRFSQISDIAIDGGFALEQGFILCAMILSAATVHLIDRRLRSAALWMAVAAGLSAIGLMHAYALNGSDAAFSMEARSWPFVRAYLALAMVFFVFSFVRHKRVESEGVKKIHP